MGTERTVYQHWNCGTCGGHLSLVYERKEHPECCGRPMTEGRIAFPAGDINEQRLHVIHVAAHESVVWPSGLKPEYVMEFWRLAPGRKDGEFIGHIGVHATMCEWVMARGVAIRNGVAPTLNQACEQMLIAIQGGLGAGRMIAEVVS